MNILNSFYIKNLCLSISLAIVLSISNILFVCEASAINHKKVIQVSKQYPKKIEQIYLKRFNSLFGGNTGQNGGLVYEPLAAVPGSNQFIELSLDNKDKKNTISSEALSQAENYALERNSQALIIWRKGKIELEKYFLNANNNTLIVGRSLAKPITVMAIGRAIKEKYIQSLDQPVSDFITEWKNTDKEPMLVRHLLDMRTGFLRQGMELTAESILNRAYLHPFHEEIIINEYPLTHTPGSRYDYSNANSEMVAPLIKRATGKNYQDWVSDEILKPLGAKGGEIWLNRKNGTAHSGCCIMLPAESFFRIGLLSYFNGIWQGHRLLPDGYIEETKKPTQQNPWSGMGLYLAEPYAKYKGYVNPDIKELLLTLHSEPYISKDLYLFDGNANQVIYIIPSEELVIMRVGNAPKKETPWDNAFIPNTIVRGIVN